MTNTDAANKLTVEDCLRGAFSALLKGDTAERDRLCDLAQTAFDGEGLKKGFAVGPIPGNTPVKQDYIDVDFEEIQ